MAADLNPPTWLKHKLDTWMVRLQMHEWEIRLGLDLVVNDDAGCKGLTEQWPLVNMGRITLRVDVEDDEEWEIVLVHELLHIKHSRVDHVLEQTLFPELAGIPATMAHSAYRQAYEPFIHSMAVALVKMSKA
jgi:hypothetical protein